MAVQFDTALTYPVSYYIRGHFDNANKVKFADATTAACDNFDYSHQPIIDHPTILGQMFLPDTAAANYLGAGQYTDYSCYILNAGGNLYMNVPNAIIAPGSLANFLGVSVNRSGGTLNYPDIYGSSGGLVLGSTFNHETQLQLTTTGIGLTGGPVQLTPLVSAPSSPTLGMIALANRTNWDPLTKGSGGPYLVWYNGSAWVAINSQ